MKHTARKRLGLIGIVVAAVAVVLAFMYSETLMTGVQNIFYSSESTPHSLQDQSGGEGADNSEVSEENTDTSDGVSGEGIGEMRTLIVGGWVSVDDPLSVLWFEAGGFLLSEYDGGLISESGTYQVFDSPEDLPSDIIPVKGERSFFLRQTFGSLDEYYEIEELDSERLEMFHISGRGTYLRYQRI